LSEDRAAPFHPRKKKKKIDFSLFLLIVITSSHLPGAAVLREILKESIKEIIVEQEETIPERHP